LADYTYKELSDISVSILEELCEHLESKNQDDLFTPRAKVWWYICKRFDEIEEEEK
jgi:hypothetical protein